VFISNSEYIYAENISINSLDRSQSACNNAAQTRATGMGKITEEVSDTGAMHIPALLAASKG
jgi:hypothetical protein